MVWKLLKNAKLYCPEYTVNSDILIVGKSIAAIDRDLSLPEFVEGEVVDLQGKTLVPGFIDAHVHICGGGGEAGPASRTPELKLSQLTRAGTTTVVGCLGTDSVSRSMAELLVKANALQDEGISTYIYSGAYQVPMKTLLPTLEQDLVLIQKVIGAGEVAISDHRSGQPQISELERLAAQARVGGMLGKKAGVIHLHLGEGKRGLDLIWKILEETEIPITQFMPTHINRTHSLLEQIHFGLPLEVALRTITANVANVLRLQNKGIIRVGYDADLVVLDEDLQVQDVWAMGKCMMRNYQTQVWGTYEQIN